MKIKEFRLDQETIESFADKYGLVMEVHERNHLVDCPVRFYAKFERAEIKDGSCLIGKFGNGRTREEAIKECASEISGKLLVINAMDKHNRRELQVPRLSSFLSEKLDI